MGSQIAVRIPDELDKEISSLAERMHLKRSDIVRLALKKFIKDIHKKEEAGPYEKVKYLVGSISSGVPDLGEEHREYLVKRFKKDA